ncbi:PD40 domain-containing protein [Kordia algicida OT-1]|uniref:WD40-like beta propeller repeat protein n=1 Tax=Kordia algicida OT-1 TaxID=391587 RepID=A9E0Y5_9FLAO|nr:PD40 domain-containing protein [Kordia algicida]EDP95558.1 WD40-like beta propeller repeat protein [Kordia algicida OT-1]
MKKILLLLLVFASTQLFAQKQATIAFEKNLTSPEIFIHLPEFKNINVRDMAISPKNDEIFFTLDAPKNAFRTILTSKKINGKWSEFSIAAFSGNYYDIEPAFSPDGTKLFFASKRPTGKEKTPKKDYDLWFVTKVNGVWKNPIRLPETINTDKNEYYPSLANNGTIYFTAERADAKGKEDIYKSEFVNGNYQTPVSLGTGVNTKTYEYNAYVSPDESFIIFGSYGRKGSLGRGDLYISFNENGIWKEAIHLGKLINSNQIDYCPFVTFDKKYFFYTSEKSTIEPMYEKMSFDTLKEVINEGSNGTSKIYYLSFEKLLKSIQLE